ncbi:MAG: glycosyltransferase family 87 protein, partial [Cyanobacteria bacterium P01_H01_bin.15]
MKWLSIHRERPSILWGLGILLLLLSSLYLGKGFYQLAIANFGDGLNLQRNAQDLFARWQEQYYVLQGHYPYFVREGSLHVNFEIGPVKSGGYPPWAFWTALFLVPSWSWPATRLYFTLLNLVALGVVGVFSYRVGAAYGRSQGLLALGSVLAISANTTTLNNGQYGLVLNALLIGMYCLLEQRRGILAGLVLAIAFIKPNVSGFFLFILIAQKRLGALVAFSAYLGFASLAVWRMTGVSPLQMINTVR